MAAGLSCFSMGSMFGLQCGYEADHMKGSVWSEQCLWSEALIFDAALTKFAALELTWWVGGAGVGSTVCLSKA